MIRDGNEKHETIRNYRAHRPIRLQNNSCDNAERRIVDLTILYMPIEQRTIAEGARKRKTRKTRDEGDRKRRARNEERRRKLETRDHKEFFGASACTPTQLQNTTEETLNTGTGTRRHIFGPIDEYEDCIIPIRDWDIDDKIAGYERGLAASSCAQEKRGIAITGICHELVDFEGRAS